MDLDDLQRLIEATFGERDRARGVPSSVAWIAEEVGELAQAVRKGSYDEQVHEFEKVQKHSAQVREAGAEVSVREAELARLEAELRARGGVESDLDRQLRLLFTF